MHFFYYLFVSSGGQYEGGEVDEPLLENDFAPFTYSRPRPLTNADNFNTQGMKFIQFFSFLYNK